MSLFGRAEARGQARGLTRERNRIDEIAQVTLADHHDSRLLRRIPGIGPINALTILAEAGDLRRFGHYRQFLKFCGLDLATCQSGTFRGRTKLSKYGNAACAERSGWRRRSPRANVTTASATSSAAMLPATRTMPIAVARR